MLPVEVVVFLENVLNIYIWIVIAAAVISWITPNPYNPVVQLLRRVTEPVLAPVRRWIPPVSGIDLSFIVVILIAYFLIAALRNF